MAVMSPGNIIQLMFLKKRISKLTSGKFIEVGVGQGYLSKVLLDLGWSGIGIDLNPDSLFMARQNNLEYVSNNKFELVQSDFLELHNIYKSNSVDLIISSMVLEHLDEKNEIKYFKICDYLLKKTGKSIIFVPASPNHWGIEDLIAGHFRRYTSDRLKSISNMTDFELKYISGLTYPLSNILFPISNYLVNKHELKLSKLSMNERTIMSGNRNVPFKTSYPKILKFILNKVTIFPFYVLSLIFRKNKNCMVLYAEYSKKQQNNQF